MKLSYVLRLFRHARLPFLDSFLDSRLFAGMALLREWHCCGNDVVAGMTLLRVYFTFVPQLSGYPFYEKNLLPEEPLKPDPGRYTNEKAAG